MIYEKQKTKNIIFPLGGIGTGCIGLAGNGELNDWEIFNRPRKNTRNGYSHFAIKATQNGKSIAKVLHGDTNENLMGSACASRGHYGYGFGPKGNSLAGFPHFKDLVFEGNFPMATLTFSDEDFPAVIRLKAFNPFIPHDDFNSSLPAAFFTWEIENITDEPVEFAIACTVCNPSEDDVNKTVYENSMKGLFFGCAKKTDSEKDYADLCILTDNEETCIQEYWYRGGWQDSCTTYWKNFLNCDRMPERTYTNLDVDGDHGTVVSYVSIEPHEKRALRFVIAWNVPIAYNYWTPSDKEPTWRNYYATQFKDSFATAKYSLDNFDYFCSKTEQFADTIQSCTLPQSVKDAVSANLSVLKTPTTLRLEDGSFWGWEGCCETVGSCFGTCQHVWNYAYAMPFLFPKLERSIRETTVKYALQENGATLFRVDLPLKKSETFTGSCVDGQMGEVVKWYREWKLSGDSEWLRQNAESIFKMLEFAWSEENPYRWDANKDGVIEGLQHHTLDMELIGPNSWLQGFYLLALDCGAKIAEFIGDENRAKIYRDLYTKGKKWMNENLFNGKYFFHKIDLSDKSLLEAFGVEHYWNSEANEIKYQIADGCEIDQMLADWHAALIGTESVFDSDKKKIALESLYRNNYKDSMRKVTNMWRNFSLNDERGTVICSYPDGVKVPAIPIPYCEETMTGFEYALAGLMIAEGYIDEGEQLISGIRDRYDGEKRNPWNEIECGSNYARSMASFALMPIYSGFSFDMTEKHIGFSPKNKNGKYIFSVGESWGTVEFCSNKYTLSVLGNPLKLGSISLPECENIKEITVDGVKIDFVSTEAKISFPDAEIKENMIFIKK